MAISETEKALAKLSEKLGMKVTEDGGSMVMPLPAFFTAQERQGIADGLNNRWFGGPTAKLDGDHIRLGEKAEKIRKSLNDVYTDTQLDSARIALNNAKQEAENRDRELKKLGFQPLAENSNTYIHKEVFATLEGAKPVADKLNSQIAELATVAFGPKGKNGVAPARILINSSKLTPEKDITATLRDSITAEVATAHAKDKETYQAEGRKAGDRQSEYHEAFLALSGKSSAAFRHDLEAQLTAKDYDDRGIIAKLFVSRKVGGLAGLMKQGNELLDKKTPLTSAEQRTLDNLVEHVRQSAFPQTMGPAARLSGTDDNALYTATQAERRAQDEALANAIHASDAEKAANRKKAEKAVQDPKFLEDLTKILAENPDVNSKSLIALLSVKLHAAEGPAEPSMPSVPREVAPAHGGAARRPVRP